jgi:hypothetical protein
MKDSNKIKNLEEQVNLLTEKYIELVNEVSREIQNDEKYEEGMDPFDFLMDYNVDRAKEIMDAYRILQSYYELLQSVKEEE